MIALDEAIRRLPESLLWKSMAFDSIDTSLANYIYKGFTRGIG